MFSETLATFSWEEEDFRFNSAVSCPSRTINLFASPRLTNSNAFAGDIGGSGAELLMIMPAPAMSAAITIQIVFRVFKGATTFSGLQCHAIAASKHSHHHLILMAGGNLKKQFLRSKLKDVYSGENGHGFRTKVGMIFRNE